MSKCLRINHKDPLVPITFHDKKMIVRTLLKPIQYYGPVHSLYKQHAYEIHLQTSKDGVFGTGATFNSNNCRDIIDLSMYV